MANHLFIRALNKCGQEISVLSRELTEAGFGDSQPVEVFTEIDTPLAIVKTLSTDLSGRGDKLFDGIQIVDGATHVFCAQYSATLDPVEHHNYFIDLSAERYKILAVTNIDERNQVIAFQAAKRGDDTAEASEA